MLLVVIDAYSKWMDVHITTKSTSEATIEKLREVFATHGLPNTLVSDNGPCFTSDEFAKFMKMNAINHIRGAPYHPATNGLAERAVQTVKGALRKMSGPLHTRLSRFLLSYRTTPQATTKQSPAELLMNRKLRTRITSVLPDVNATVEKKQFAQKIAHTTHALREFNVGDDVLVRNYARGNQWLPGKITDRTGPVSYVVNVSVDGATLKWKRHVDQLRSRVSSSTARKQDYANEGVVPTLDEDDVINSDNDNNDREDYHADQVDIREAREDDFDENRDVNRDAGRKDYPRRERRKPNYYGFE
eukprot:XP_011677816.1 PREDICTED: uncharacterized protein K02A2.6-like [Strongylocentrotus purpuratus]